MGPSSPQPPCRCHYGGNCLLSGFFGSRKIETQPANPQPSVEPASGQPSAPSALPSPSGSAAQSSGLLSPAPVAPAPAPADDILPNLLAVHKYLERTGWKISQAGLYKHAKEGKIRPKKGGGYEIKAINRYAANWLAPVDGAAPLIPEPDTLSRRKLEAETARAEEQAANMALRNSILRERWVPRTFAEREIAMRAGIFRADRRNFNRTRAQDIIALVGGDPARAAELVAFLDDADDAIFARYCQPIEFEVPAAVPSDDSLDDDAPAAAPAAGGGSA